MTEDGKLLRLIHEHKRLSENKEEEIDASVQVKAMDFKQSPNDQTDEYDAKTRPLSKATRYIDIELMKQTKCGICKQIGHWKRECPTTACEIVEGEK